MNEPLPWNEIKQQVYERAGGCCEYCCTCEANTGQTMQVDHIDPDGDDVLDNLCLACWNCNNHKRKAMLVKDAVSGVLAPLFNPRTQLWTDHFEWIKGATLLYGLTPTGRVTIIRLKMNRLALVAARQRWAAVGYHPPAYGSTISFAEEDLAIQREEQQFKELQDELYDTTELMHRLILRFLLQNTHMQSTLVALGPQIGYTEVTLRKNPPMRLIQLKLLQRRRIKSLWYYTACDTRAALKKRYPHLDGDLLIQRLIEACYK